MLLNPFSKNKEENITPSHSGETRSQKPMENIGADERFKEIDKKMKLLSQRLKIIESNEKVIGRTLTELNKKVKKLESSNPE
jgi:hypothetical protein